jgi:hypothetical protein
LIWLFSLVFVRRPEWPIAAADRRWIDSMRAALSRPLRESPKLARYRGTSDLDSAASFVCE